MVPVALVPLLQLAVGTVAMAAQVVKVRGMVRLVQHPVAVVEEQKEHPLVLEQVVPAAMAASSSASKPTASA